MSFLLRLFVLLIFVVSLALASAAFIAIDDYPTVDRAAEITPANVERAKRILDKNDPRKMKPGAVRTISVSQGDFDVAANYLAHRYGNGSARTTLESATLQIDASLRLPMIPARYFANVEVALAENSSLPRIDHLRIGDLSVPPWLAHWLITRALVLSLGEENSAAVISMIKKVSLSRGRVAVTYEWQANLPDKFRAALLSATDQDRLGIHNELLVEISRSLPGKKISLLELLIPLVKLAQERSQAGDPIAENRAAIVILTLYVTGKRLTDIVPEAKDWPRPERHDVTLNGRQDSSQHFMVSTALAANAGGPLSDAVGIYKELADSRGGSGFSFKDIAADRAGTRFGELAAKSRESAATWQRRLSAGVREKDLMPATQDLPEFMPEAEFKRRFRGVDAPEYKRMMVEIERRIAALALYR
jgi:hypothetical protein